MPRPIVICREVSWARTSCFGLVVEQSLVTRCCRHLNCAMGNISPRIDQERLLIYRVSSLDQAFRSAQAAQALGRNLCAGSSPSEAQSREPRDARKKQDIAHRGVWSLRRWSP
jgi:hypothetical protein